EEKKIYPFAEKGARFSSIDEIAKMTDIIIIAVKPKDITHVLYSLKGNLNSSQIVVSIAAGVTMSFISKILGNSIPVVRVMPNIAISVGEGICVLSTGSVIDAGKIKFIEKIFSSVGKVIELPEDKFDAVTALSGSGPAYVYVFIQGLIKGGEKAGLSPEVSRKLATQTVLGAAKMVQESEESLEELIKSVATPGGTTVAALDVLKEGKMIDLISKAIEEAAKRANKISLEIVYENKSCENKR
ncbi:pyrroline-5-carboxylate reductase, partial [Candidatus Aerophobetes bacterium]|nr:pyrroline-5-carboxylate reductase [Candidatus Aerophobetes bacterium]